MYVRKLTFAAASLSAATVLACQAYNMEEVDPQTVIAVETYGTYTKGKPPTLLIVQDRSGSMEICFDPAARPGSGGSCQVPGQDQPVEDRRSRMVVAREVMEHTVEANRNDVWFGLVVYGVPESAAESCGPPVPLVDPSASSAEGVIAAYRGDERIVSPAGGTPTTAALLSAYERLVDEEGKLRHGDRDNYVVLVTDGLMNCNASASMPCLCSQEAGCFDTEKGSVVELGEEGTFILPDLCLDDDESLHQVHRLLQAGVKTFVIGLGDTFSTEDALSSRTLDQLAEAGGVPRRDHAQKFYSAADEAELEAALDDIIRQIAAPCTYDLDGPVCDGRLVKVALRIDGEMVETTCDSGLVGEADWFFTGAAEGKPNPQQITFSAPLCQRMAEAEKVEISIRGVENACPDQETHPACDLSAGG